MIFIVDLYEKFQVYKDFGVNERMKIKLRYLIRILRIHSVFKYDLRHLITKKF